MTRDTATDAMIISEYSSMSSPDKQNAAREIDVLLKQHDMPFDKGIKVMQSDFSNIASKFNIHPATLFCVYMDFKKP